MSRVDLEIDKHRINTAKPTLSDLSMLVEELLKSRPAEDKIRNYMERSGLVYTEDPITRMETVLKALNGLSRSH